MEEYEEKNYRRILTGILLDNWNTIGNILLRIKNRSLEIELCPENWRNTIKCEEYDKYLKYMSLLLEDYWKNILRKITYYTINSNITSL